MFTQSVYKKRIAKLSKALSADTLYIFSHPKQIEYYTGFTFLVSTEREAFLVASKNFFGLIHSSFTPVEKFDFFEYFGGAFPSQLKQHIETVLHQTGIKKIQYDATTLYVNELTPLQTIPEVTLRALQVNPIPPLMAIKEAVEIKRITKACSISKQVFETVKQHLKPGMTELEIAEQITDSFKTHGITQLAFPTIVAFGSNAAKPHHQPTELQLQEDTPVLIDMGGKYQGYCADMTRTFWFGSNPSSTFRKIETIVKDAYTKALETISKHHAKEVTAKEVDNAARVYISNAGYGDNFIHTTGHGLGIEIHETPSLSWSNTQVLQRGMVVTIEPGIYLEGNIGYRHENTVVLTQTGADVL